MLTMAQPNLALTLCTGYHCYKDLMGIIKEEIIEGMDTFAGAIVQNGICKLDADIFNQRVVKSC
jgi:hypothetical protein